MSVVITKVSQLYLYIHMLHIYIYIYIYIYNIHVLPYGSGALRLNTRRERQKEISRPGSYAFPALLLLLVPMYFYRGHRFKHTRQVVLNTFRLIHLFFLSLIERPIAEMSKSKDLQIIDFFLKRLYICMYVCMYVCMCVCVCVCVLY